MEVDNFYQRSSEKLFVPRSKRQKEKEQKERMAYEKEAPIIASTIKRLRNQVDLYSSVLAIKEEKDAEKFMIEVAINTRVVIILSKEIERLEMEVKKFSHNK